MTVLVSMTEYTYGLVYINGKLKNRKLWSLYVKGWSWGQEEAAWCTVPACVLFVAPELDSLYNIIDHGMCW